MNKDQTLAYARALCRELGQFKGRTNERYQERAAMIETELANVGYAVDKSGKLVELKKPTPAPKVEPKVETVKSAAAGVRETTRAKAPETT